MEVARLGVFLGLAQGHVADTAETRQAGQTNKRRRPRQERSDKSHRNASKTGRGLHGANNAPSGELERAGGLLVVDRGGADLAEHQALGVAA